MKKINKRKKAKEKKNKEEKKIDRISDLPDDLLVHILSFLPTKYSVRSSVLSRRWDSIYTLVPVIDFSYDDRYIGRYGDFIIHNVDMFIHSVDSLFRLGVVKYLSKFSIHFLTGLYEVADRIPINSWISNAILKQVKEIKIDINNLQNCTLPLDIFTNCKSLTCLSVAGYFDIVLAESSSVCFPCLTDCRFRVVKFDDQSAKYLFRNCPALKYLSIWDCTTYDDKMVLDISVPSLKNLKVYSFSLNIELNVPGLLCFDYNGTGTNLLGLESLKSTVVEASICYDSPYQHFEDSVAVEITRSICHVEKLHINGELIEGFLNSDYSWPMFDKLTRLECYCSLDFPLVLLAAILNNTPRLEYLSLTGCRLISLHSELFSYKENQDVGDDENDIWSSERVPQCVYMHLKEVEFTNKLSCERKLVEYFLKFAKALEKLKIWSKSSWDEQFEVNSEVCQVVFQEYDGSDEDDY